MDVQGHAGSIWHKFLELQVNGLADFAETGQPVDRQYSAQIGSLRIRHGQDFYRGRETSLEQDFKGRLSVVEGLV